jgi:hypothetical protein
MLGEPGEVTFRSSDACELAPGQITELVIEKRWTWRGDPYASGRIDGARIDVPRLGKEDRLNTDCRCCCIRGGVR